MSAGDGQFAGCTRLVREHLDQAGIAWADQGTRERGRDQTAEADGGKLQSRHHSKLYSTLALETGHLKRASPLRQIGQALSLRA